MANEVVDHGRRRFLTATTAVVGGIGVVSAAVPFIKSWEPSARAKAAGAPVTQSTGKIEAGQKLTVSLARPAGVRGQPHQGRSSTRCRRVDSRLVDPKSDGARPAAEVRAERDALDQAGMAGRGRHLHPSGLRAGLRARRSSPSRSTRTGRAASTAPATSRATTWPAASSTACRRRRTCRCRRTTSSTTRTIHDWRGSEGGWLMANVFTAASATGSTSARRA